MDTTPITFPATSAANPANKLEALAMLTAMKADGARAHIAEMNRRLECLKTRPAWELMSRAYLDEAENELIKALDIVGKAKARFDALPVGTHYLEAAE